MKSLSTFVSAITLWIVLGFNCPGQETSDLSPFTLDQLQPGIRARRFEFFALGQYWNVAAFTMLNVHSSFFPPTTPTDAHFPHEARFTPGFGFGYNVNNHLAVRSEFAFCYRDYVINNRSLDIFTRHSAFVNEGKLNLDYNILSSKFTPFVTGGVGYLYLGPDEKASFPEWHFALNAAGGVRWDITDHLFVKGYAGASWANVDHPDWVATFQASIAAGWKF